MQEHLLKNVKHRNGEFIQNWQFITDDEKEGKWRLYYKPYESEKSGFCFYSLSWAGNNCDYPTWSPETLIDTLYYGYAFFDGLRHVYLGADEDGIYGYTNYPNADIHITIWQKLKELENEHCKK